MAKMELIILLYLLLFVITPSFKVVNGGYGTMVGGKTQISDVKTNKEVQELGRFSVEEYNSRSQSRHGRRRFISNNNGRTSSSASSELVFSQVVEAEKQVVSGIKYYLKIEAMQNRLISRRFESVVVVKPWLHNSKELLHFSPSTQ